MLSLSLSLSLCLCGSNSLSLSLSVSVLSVCLSVYLSVCLSVCLSLCVCLSVCPSLSLSLSLARSLARSRCWLASKQAKAKQSKARQGKARQGKAALYRLTSVRRDSVHHRPSSSSCRFLGKRTPPPLHHHRHNYHHHHHHPSECSCSQLESSAGPCPCAEQLFVFGPRRDGSGMTLFLLPHRARQLKRPPLLLLVSSSVQFSVVEIVRYALRKTHTSSTPSLRGFGQCYLFKHLQWSV